MNWNDITVQQFQEVHRLSLSAGIDDMDKVTNTIGILYNKSEKEIGDMSVSEINHLARECSFLLTNNIPGKAVKSIRIGTKKFAIPYKPSALKYRQYVELISFSDNLIENLHNIMASIIQPVRYGFKMRNNVHDHPAVSEAMLDAKIVDVYHSCVFFCKVFISSIEAIRGSLVAEMMKKGSTKEQAETWLSDSINAMAGCIPPSKLQNMRD